MRDGVEWQESRSLRRRLWSDRLRGRVSGATTANPAQSVGHSADLRPAQMARLQAALL